MYPYNKSRNKPAMNAKETSLFGPQFSLHASATTVNERPFKPSAYGNRESTPPLRAQESRLLSPGLRKPASSSHAPVDIHFSNNAAGKTKPGDRVIFAENPNNSGVPLVYRTAEDKSTNPDRLNLDRRRLTVCPVLEGEDNLRLLNYQHNMISRIQHLHMLRKLIFLDLYDNQIEEINGLNNLKSLRVLMLGKNRIGKVENLDSLSKLDVLDLHGNRITFIKNLNHLHELRVLNLAGNMIQHVDNLMGMDVLTELNLRRNRVRTVSDIDNLPKLQRLFLSFNDIASFEDILCLGESTSLSEVSLDGNPFSQDSNYKQVVLRNMQQLEQLDMKKISDDERRMASVMARREEEKKRETNKIQVMKEKRRQAINNARRQWEVMQGSMMLRTNKLVTDDTPESVANHVGNFPNDLLHDTNSESETSSLEKQSNGCLSRPVSAKSLISDRPPSSLQRPSSTGNRHSASNSDSGKISYSGTTQVNDGGVSVSMDYLAELDGDTLNLYGPGSLDALDKNWGMSAAGSVTTVHFKFIDFEEITKYLHKIRARFPAVINLVFNSTNIHNLHQLNALSSLRKLDHLNIEPDGNPVTSFSLWRSYALFRLAHFSLKKINDTEVSASDVVSAEKFFGPLAHITTSQLPQSRISSLLGETKRKQLQAVTEEKAKKSADNTNASSNKTSVESVGRAGLNYISSDALQAKLSEQESRKEFVSSYVQDLVKDAILVDQKRVALRKIWDEVLVDMVKNTVLDMWDSQTYMKKCLEELDKT